MLRGFVSGLVDIVYPRRCLVCKKDLRVRLGVDNLVCVSCWSLIKKNLPPFCSRCGRHLENASFNKKICPPCIKKNLHFDRAFSPCVYEGVIKNLIHQFKYQNKDYLGVALARPMAQFIREYRLPMEVIDIVVPMPLHQARHREREFNQAEVLGEDIAGEFRKTIACGALLRHRHTQTQTELEEDKRFANVKGSFRAKDERQIKNKNILLIDDVLTTGATSSEAALTLKEAGANIVFVLTLAN